MKKILFAAFAMLFAFSSCVQDKMYPYPSIADISNTIAYDETEAVIVTATVTAFIDIQEVNLVYKAGGSPQKVKMVAGTGNIYAGEIPPMPMGTEVIY